MLPVLGSFHLWFLCNPPTASHAEVSHELGGDIVTFCRQVLASFMACQVVLVKSEGCKVFLY